MKTRTFVDSAVAEVRAGRGGDGSGSFRRESHVPEGGPDGGDGGRGGNVIVRASTHADSLLRVFYEPRLFAENGVNGTGQKMHGRNGEDLIVDVPCGTEVYNLDTEAFLGEVLEHGDELVIAKGGRGGWGNVHFKSSVNQAPEKFIPGDEGEAFSARFELKTIADAGLVGFPNAGKSSLLAAMSAARPKIANYPFTTLHPIVGTVVYEDYATLRVADIPGIIEGAADGVGLGLTFLRHISRSKMLVYVLDMADTENLPENAYRVLRAEVENYDPELAQRPALVIANKMDEPAAQEHYDTFVAETGITPLRLSLVEEGKPGLDAVRAALRKELNPQAKGQSKREAKPRQEVDHTEVSAERFRMATFLKP
ncbi:MAG: GTPase ObgE [Kiritimatiellae bacterium]|nr:GTPase ObgE [Kiritimatiellia bacterium]